MADETNDIQTDQTTDQVVTDDQVDSQTTDQQTIEQDSDKGKGFFHDTMDWIKDKIASKPAEDTSDDTGDGSLVGTDIPDEFSTVAEALGWEADDIIDFASKGNNGQPYTDDELKAMVPELTGILEEHEKKDTQQTDKQTTDQTTDDKKTTDDPNAKLRAELKQEILKELGVESVQEIRDEITQSKQDREDTKTTQLVTRVNELFDDASKEFKVLGLTKDLPKYPVGPNKGEVILSSPQFKARAEVYNDAAAFMTHQNLSIDEAMGKALDLYRGRHLKEDTRREVVKDLKKQETNLSGPRTAREVKKDYQSAREEDIDYIRNLQRAATGRETQNNEEIDCMKK